MSRRGKGESGERDAWVWLSLLPFGIGTFVPLIPGARYKVRGWTALGVGWITFTFGAAIVSASEKRGHATLGGLLLVLAWAGGAITSFVIRSQVRRRRRAGILGQATTGPDPWPWISLAPIGLGSWAPVIAGQRCRVWWWTLAGLAGAAACIAGFVLAAAAHSATGENRVEAGIAGMLFIGSWMGGISVSFAIRPSYNVRRGLPPRVTAPWPQPTERSRRWTARYALTAYAATFIVVILISVLFDDVLNVSLSVGAGVLMVDATLLLALVPLVRRQGLSFKDLGIRPTRAMPSLWLVIQSLVAYLVVGVIYAIITIGESTTHDAGAISQIQNLSTPAVVVAIIAISISAPVVEEIFFRGLLYRGLRNRLPVPYAALIAGLLFGLVHITGYPLVTLPIKAFFGVIACLIYERTGSLLPGMALHSFVDASGVDIGLTGNDYTVLIVAGALIAAILLRFGWQKLHESPSDPLTLAQPTVATSAERLP